MNQNWADKMFGNQGFSAFSSQSLNHDQDYNTSNSSLHQQDGNNGNHSMMSMGNENPAGLAGMRPYFPIVITSPMVWLRPEPQYMSHMGHDDPHPSSTSIASSTIAKREPVISVTTQVSRSSPENKKFRKKRCCKICGQPGHDVRNCKQVIQGDDSNDKEKQKAIAQRRSCGICGQPGHDIRTCPENQGGRIDDGEDDDSDQDAGISRRRRSKSGGKAGKRARANSGMISNASNIVNNSSDSMNNISMNNMNMSNMGMNMGMNMNSVNMNMGMMNSFSNSQMPMFASSNGMMLQQPPSNLWASLLNSDNMDQHLHLPGIDQLPQQLHHDFGVNDDLHHTHPSSSSHNISLTSLNSHDDRDDDDDGNARNHVHVHDHDHDSSSNEGNDDDEIESIAAPDDSK